MTEFAVKKYDQLKQKHLKEMQDLLDKEEIQENEREKQIQNVDD
eukprot:CAMPEP_0202953022 /NCGR_PEP_ID=MMETSP1395-20130829/42807_1 /ASSEMBLY_ACC=CAM_ASM_000871 /TAXON_ID=5961 /ORGANISM="Blepharisma japonicum, Strain Stock R1072" /LENGTH=43 /DNA_ID= /DNA_START= /DNA_END= /DNA_ORIENTATION=